MRIPDFREKLEQAGLDPVAFPEIKTYIDEAFNILVLIWPIKGHILYQKLVGEQTEASLAEKIRVDVRTISRWLRGDGDDLGAEDWFIIILQLIIEAESMGSDFTSKMIQCFYPFATGESTPLREPFHRSFFLALLETMVGSPSLQDMIRSLPWRNSKEIKRVASSADLIQTVAWPCFRPPLKNNKLPGLLIVLNKCSYAPEPELSWICLMIVFLSRAAKEDIWFRLLEILNVNNPKITFRHKGIPEASVNSNLEDICQFIKELKSSWMRFAALGLLAKTPYPWEQLIAYCSEYNELKNAKQDKRVVICGKKAFLDRQGRF